MGKEYFEFLEEEYMGLTSQVQQGLKQQQVAAQDGPNTVRVDLPLLFTRCQAIYQQMQVESRKNPEFKERLTLYNIQLSALLEHYQSSLFPAAAAAPLPKTKSTNTNNKMSKASTKASADAVSTVPSPTKAAASTLRQELTFTFTINEEDDYDTSLH